MLITDHDRTTQVFADTMHLMKNVTSELVQLITGYKDSQKVRKQNFLANFHQAGYRKTKKNLHGNLQQLVSG